MNSKQLFSILVSAILFLSLLFAPSVWAQNAPTFSLYPSSGDAPSASGSIGGADWKCSRGSAPAGSATVSGVGVSGSASINRAGNLLGSFSLRGSADARITVTVKADMACPGSVPVFLSGSATFAFNPPPASVPPPPVAPAPTPIAPTPTPSKEAKPGFTVASTTIRFIGCSPAASTVRAELDPVAGQHNVSSFTAPVTEVAAEPGAYILDVREAQAGTVYKVNVQTDDPSCPAAAQTAQSYLLPGKELNVNITPAGKTELSANLFSPPLATNWEKEISIVGYERAKKQPFKVTTELEGVQSLKLQASLFPMATDIATDPLSPPGLLATWEVGQGCGSKCQVSSDLSELLPPQPAKSWVQKGLGYVKTFLTAIGSAIKQAVSYVGSVLGYGGAEQPPAMDSVKQVALPPPSQTSLGGQVTAKGKPSLPTDFYFRVVPLDKSGKPAGNPSNSVKVHWSAQAGDSGPDFKLPVAEQKPHASWFMEVVSYHGYIKPKKGENCFVVTENATGLWTQNHFHAPGDPSHPGLSADPKSALNHKYFKDDIICPPEPPEDGCGWSDPISCVEDITNYFVDAVNLVSKVYTSAKDAAAEFAADGLGEIPGVSDVLGAAGCDKNCLKGALNTGMDVALTSMGVPPEIPNIAELQEQGLDYLAEQAVEASGLPPAALDAAKAAGVDPHEKIKEGIKNSLAQMAKSYAKSVDWLPEGVPVRPDGIVPPAVTVKVTRSANDPPGDCDGGILGVGTFATLPADFPGYHPSYVNKNVVKLDLWAGGTFQLFKNKNIPLPCAAPGTSLILPIVFEPNYPQWLYNKPDQSYFWWLYQYAASAEMSMHVTPEGGQLKFNFAPYNPKW